MKTYYLYLLLICLPLISCSGWEQTPLPPTLEPILFEAEGLGTPHARDESPFVWVLFGTEAVYMQKGLTRAGKIQLEQGQTSYFLLNFHTETDKKLRAELEANNMKIIWKTRAYVMVRVKPAALSYLQQLSEKGTLKYGGPMPPRAKFGMNMHEDLKRKKDTDQIRVIVTLLTQHPTAEEKAEVATWFDTEKKIRAGTYIPLPLEPGKHEPYYLAAGLQLIGTIKVEHIPILLEIPVVFRINIPSPF